MFYYNDIIRPHGHVGIGPEHVSSLYNIQLVVSPTIMSAPKAKSVTNGTKKPKGPTPTDGPTDATLKAPVVISGKPDKAAYEAEQQRIRTEIDVVQGNLVRSHVRRFAISYLTLLRRML